MRHLMRAAALAAGLAAAGPAAAYDLALLIGNEDYRSAIGDVEGARGIARLSRALEADGFEVRALVDATREEAQAALTDFAARAPEAERLLVMLNGQFVSAGERAWLLPADLRERPALLDLPAQAIDVGLLVRVMEASDARPRAMLLGTARAGQDAGTYLTTGTGDLPGAAGVPVITGAPRDLVALARNTLLEPGAVLQARDLPAGAAAAGLPRTGLAFTPRTPAPAPAPAPQAPAASEGGFEGVMWRQAEASDDQAGYEAYLRAYPEGEYARIARLRLDAIQGAPSQAEQRAEAVLGLGRDQRRAIQRDLTALGYDTRGVDGIFGSGTRGAIRAWQGANGHAATGYLSAAQVAQIADQGGARAAAGEAADREFWRRTGARGDDRGLRDYLGRYPQGIYATEARDRLAGISGGSGAAAGGGTAALADSLAWDEAEAAGTEVAFRRYLDRYPSGAYVGRAQARIAAIREAAEAEAGAAAGAAAERAERSLGLNPITARLIEAQLEALGLQPGAVDGTFDGRTREAIRAYQQSRQMPVTGYVDQRLVTGLLADAIFR